MHDPVKIARTLSRQLVKTVHHLEKNGPTALSGKKDNLFGSHFRKILQALIQDQKKIEAELKKRMPDERQLSKLVTKADTHMQAMGDLITKELKQKLPGVG